MHKPWQDWLMEKKKKTRTYNLKIKKVITTGIYFYFNETTDFLSDLKIIKEYIWKSMDIVSDTFQGSPQILKIAPVSLEPSATQLPLLPPPPTCGHSWSHFLLRWGPGSGNMASLTPSHHNRNHRTSNHGHCMSGIQLPQQRGQVIQAGRAGSKLPMG